VQKQYDILFDFLKMVAACQKPDQQTLESLVTPFASSIEAISQEKEAYRRDRGWFSHPTLLSEGALVIGWVVSVSLC
jgi:adenylyl cyclase-associated protein